MTNSLRCDVVPEEAAATVTSQRTHLQEEWIVLDSSSQFDGLERMFVIGVGLDQPVSQTGSCSKVYNPDPNDYSPSIRFVQWWCMCTDELV